MSREAFRLIYTSHPTWPLPLSPSPSSVVSVAVLDSSFNPPHLAHLALVLHPTASTRLLLFSSKNADKVPAPGEPTTDQRLEMMRRMAHEGVGTANVAVACISEPTFVGKSRLLKRELGLLAGGEERVRLCFVQGWDTLIRFFDPKYYQPPNEPMESALAAFFDAGSTIACARRGDVSLEAEEEFLNRENVRRWRGGVEMFGLEDEGVRGVSSTAVRKAVRKGGQGLEAVVLPSVANYIRETGLYR